MILSRVSLCVVLEMMGLEFVVYLSKFHGPKWNDTVGETNLVGKAEHFDFRGKLQGTRPTFYTLTIQDFG